MGFRCPRPEDLSGEGQGAGFGSEGWLAKGSGAIWMQRIYMGSKNGRFIEVCSLARRSRPINAIGHWGTTIKECVSVVLPNEQRRGGVIWDKKGCLRPL